MINNSAESLHLVPRPGDHHGVVPEAPEADVVDLVRQALESARQAGHPAPGRPTLVRLTGATEHAIRKALAELANQNASAGESHHQPIGDLDVQALGGNGVRQSDGINSNADFVSPSESHPPAPATAPPAGGRAVAWTGLVFGGLASLAANWLHTWLPAVRQPPGWTPGLAPQLGATVWPIALLVAVEVVARVRWPNGWAWALARYAGAGLVAAGSAVISYGHLHDVLASWQYGPLAAAVGPLVLDGLMTVCGLALLADTHQRSPRVVRRSTRPGVSRASNDGGG